MKNQKRLDNKGFSLVELIVVIAIMAVLMGVLAPTLIGNIEKSRESTDLQNLDTIRGAVVTAMADEAIYKQVMAGTTTTENGTTSTNPVVINLGAANAASLDAQGLGAYPLLQAELKTTITSSIAMKSTAAGTSNSVYIVVQPSGAVTAVVSSAAPSATDMNAVACSKTKDDGGDPKDLLSGHDYAETTTAGNNG